MYEGCDPGAARRPPTCLVPSLARDGEERRTCSGHGSRQKRAAGDLRNAGRNRHGRAARTIPGAALRAGAEPGRRGGALRGQSGHGLVFRARPARRSPGGDAAGRAHTRHEVAAESPRQSRAGGPSTNGPKQVALRPDPVHLVWRPPAKHAAAGPLLPVLRRSSVTGLRVRGAVLRCLGEFLWTMWTAAPGLRRRSDWGAGAAGSTWRAPRSIREKSRCRPRKRRRG